MLIYRHTCSVHTRIVVWYLISLNNSQMHKYTEKNIYNHVPMYTHKSHTDTDVLPHTHIHAHTQAHTHTHTLAPAWYGACSSSVMFRHSPSSCCWTSVVEVPGLSCKYSARLYNSCGLSTPVCMNVCLQLCVLCFVCLSVCAYMHMRMLCAYLGGTAHVLSKLLADLFHKTG